MGYLPKLKCHAGRANSTNGFTDGRVYAAIRRSGSGFIVLNDNGHERFETGRGLSPHLIFRYSNDNPPHHETQSPVGTFEIIEESEQ